MFLVKHQFNFGTGMRLLLCRTLTPYIIIIMCRSCQVLCQRSNGAFDTIVSQYRIITLYVAEGKSFLMMLQLYALDLAFKIAMLLPSYAFLRCAHAQQAADLLLAEMCEFAIIISKLQKLQ